MVIVSRVTMKWWSEPVQSGSSSSSSTENTPPTKVQGKMSHLRAKMLLLLLFSAEARASVNWFPYFADLKVFFVSKVDVVLFFR